MHVPNATKYYGKFENLNFDIFCKKSLFQFKKGFNFYVRTQKKTYNISKIIYTKFYIRNRKQEDFRFCQKIEKLTFFEIFEFLLLFISVFNYLECFTLHWNF
jgi:hypothetical protein